jgi:hypothetical protein
MYKLHFTEYTAIMNYYENDKNNSHVLALEMTRNLQSNVWNINITPLVSIPSSITLRFVSPHLPMT